MTWPILGALYHPPGGIIRHDAVVWGFAKQVGRAGIEIHQGVEVTGFDVRDGRCHGVRTTKGDISCDVVAERHRRLVEPGRRSSPGSACRSRPRSCRRSSPSP